jgi:CBS domain-containing protein
MSSSQISRGSDRTPTLEHARVEDVMHPGIVSCPPETELVTVARAMAAHHIHAIVVSGVERTDGGERLTWGLLSSLDLVASALPGRAATEAGDLAGTEVVTVEAGESLERAAQLMVEHELAHLLVVSAKAQPIGIVSTLDVAGCLAWGEA